MSGIEWDFTDNSETVIFNIERKKLTMLEEIGQKGVGFTKANITAAGRVDTGQYRNSITHRVKPDENAVYIGSNLEHAIYNEVGTGRYASDGSGGLGYWVYVAGQDEETRATYRRTTRKRYALEEAKRIVAIMNANFERKNLPYRAYYTQGIKPIHALQKAASEHDRTYKSIIKKKMKE